MFPRWRSNALVGSLKGSALYRIIIGEAGEYVGSETLLSQLARIRDIEVGADGNIYLLLEHADGGQILRMTPTPGTLTQNDVEISWIRSTGLLPPLPMGTGPILRNTPFRVFVPAINMLRAPGAFTTTSINRDIIVPAYIFPDLQRLHAIFELKL